LDNIITVTWRDIYKDGFQIKGKANAVFLDLPSPWLAIDSANEALVPNGKICTFSPCIEQVQRNCTALRKANFLDLYTVECLLRPYEIINRSLKPLPDTEHQPKRKKDESHNEPKKRARDDTSATEEKSTEKNEEPTTVNEPAARSVSVAFINPLTDIKGHTGFLTFARKPIN
jgi:tRNA (adenine57-N1/adenine58-N1)-methyltransferase